MTLKKECRHKCCGCQNMRRHLRGHCQMPTRDSRTVIKKNSFADKLCELNILSNEHWKERYKPK